MTIDEIVTLIQAVSDNGMTSLEYTDGTQKLVLKKKKRKNITLPAAAGNILAENPGLLNSGLVELEEKEETEKKNKSSIASDKVVVSPLVGTFYASSGPGAEPYVRVGDYVKKGQVLGIVEAMKLMNEIESEYDGVIEAILIENEGLVEYGQPLFRIR